MDDGGGGGVFVGAAEREEAGDVNAGDVALAKIAFENVLETAASAAIPPGSRNLLSFPVVSVALLPQPPANGCHPFRMKADGREPVFRH